MFVSIWYSVKVVNTNNVCFLDDWKTFTGIYTQVNRKKGIIRKTVCFFLLLCFILWSTKYMDIQYTTVVPLVQLPTCVILPDAQIWLSFSITIPLRSCLCMDTPPTSMAYFSTRRKPGVVLRVPATSPCQPLTVAIAWSWEQRVAIPEARARQLRAGLSPRSRHLAGPLTTAVSVMASGPVEVRSDLWRTDKNGPL